MRIYSFFRNMKESIISGFRDGFHTGLTEGYDPQEEARQRVLSNIHDESYTDKEVWNSIVTYCKEHDKTVRLTRTNNIIKALKDRPGVLNLLRAHDKKS